MKIKRILLTGDDGYNSAGTRLLIHLLRDKYDLTIVGTRTQQSAVGGKITLADGFDWCETSVDGIPALCVDGTPGDGTELAAAYFKESFDVVISGVNWGVNLGTAIFGSGTVNAALRALSVGVAKKGIAISWDLPPQFYVTSHHENDSIEPFLEYPGKVLTQLLKLIFQKQLWGADLLNINLPLEMTTKVKFSQPIISAQQIYDYSVYKVKKGNKEKKHFTYTKQRTYQTHLKNSYDVKAITNHFISITPCKFNILNDVVYQKYQNLKFDLKK